jgi:hypothetical protein
MNDLKFYSKVNIYTSISLNAFCWWVYDGTSIPSLSTVFNKPAIDHEYFVINHINLFYKCMIDGTSYPNNL